MKHKTEVTTLVIEDAPFNEIPLAVDEHGNIKWDMVLKEAEESNTEKNWELSLAFSY